MDDKDTLPRYSPVDEYAVRRRTWRRRRHHVVRLFLLGCLGYFIYTHSQAGHESGGRVPLSGSPAALHEDVLLLSADRLHADYATCSKLRSKPTDPSGPRERSARYVDGHKPHLIRNATVWTGEPAAGTTPEDARSGIGYSWDQADVLMQYGLIQRVEANIADHDLPDDCVVYEAHGRQLTAGIVDMHSHTGVNPLPDLRGSSDDNELSSDITPYVRSLDGLNPLDHQIQVIKSGGVTTSLILPGSGNNMGGEAYVIKHAVGHADGRTEISAEDMLADPDKTHRYMKMACGENPKRVYGRVGRGFGPFSRMGEAWYFRHAFEQASALVSAQDDWCASADALGVQNMHTYLPQELEWESLGALLRGQVLLNTHCYTVPDLEAFIRHTNEFKFEIRAFHHAHQTYLVPELLKRAYGGRAPASALFADNEFYKAESYVGSEQAGKILWENGLTPVYVSDNPVLNAQHVVFEAAKAYKNGLPYHVALAGVTSASAEILGLGERIGKVKAGFDADIVLWDSDPLAVGAAPVQVWIDGTPQFPDPVELKKPITEPLHHPEYLASAHGEIAEHSDVVFSGITKVLLPGYEQSFSTAEAANAVVKQGSIICLGDCAHEIFVAQEDGIAVVPLHNGHIAPTLTAFGSTLGLVEIEAEDDTTDGENNDETFSRAIDGLAFDTKQLNAAYTHGVTKAITAPQYNAGGFKGVSAGFLTGATHAQESGAVWKDEVALHWTIAKTDKSPSFSSSIGQLKAALIKAAKANETTPQSEQFYLQKVVNGTLPLVISTHSADIIASLLRVKKDVESVIGSETVGKSTSIRLIILGGAESHLVAESLAKANVGVVLSPLLAYSVSWDERRSLTGAPLTNGTAIDVLHAAGVKVAIGSDEQLPPRDLFLSAGIALVNSGGKISEKEAIGFVSEGIYGLLEIEDERGSSGEVREFTVFEGTPLGIEGRLKAIADGRGGVGVFV